MQFTFLQRERVGFIMRLSKYLLPTLREVPAEAEIESHKLMLRAGMMRKLASGVYSYLPLGLKALRNVEKIIKNEMENEDAVELLMPALLPAESYMASGRWEVFGSSMFRLKDRGNRDFCLGPTHEEIFTDTVKNSIKSYKQLPLILYQSQTKYRDEARPRFGVIRSREFVMKDAYSFDVDEKGLDVSYDKMYRAYRKAFDKMELDYIVVDADSGAMGGSGSQEFMVKSDIGEDTIVYCEKCGYSANIEKAQCIAEKCDDNGEMKDYEKIHTPNSKTIEELTEFLKSNPKCFAKTLIYRADDKFVAVMVRGDRDVNEVKLANHLGAVEVELAAPADVIEITHAQVGFAGPIGIDIDVLADNEVANMKNFIVGANETDYHYINVNINKDFTPAFVGDFRNSTPGDECPHCHEGKVKVCKGIEIGHIFKLGKKYTEALECTYLDENGKKAVPIMGCYGIGVNRCIAAIIEQNCDERGIIWPMSVAPFKVIVVSANSKDASQVELADKIYNELKANGVEVLYDDRNERAGVKFNDADLIGIPLRITAGKKSGEGIVEFKERRSGEVTEMTPEDAVKKCIEIIKSQM